MVGDAASAWSCRPSSCMPSFLHFLSHILLFTAIPRLFPPAVWVVLFVVMSCWLYLSTHYHLSTLFLDFDPPAC